MSLASTFKVGPYECYVASMNLPYVDIILSDTYPILQAERAASTVARLLGSSDIELKRVGGVSPAAYGCKIFSVKVKELEQWQKLR